MSGISCYRSGVGRYALTKCVCRLLEQIAVSVSDVTPLLLVGETGCGKTAAIQFLANYTGLLSDKLVEKSLPIQF